MEQHTDASQEGGLRNAHIAVRYAELAICVQTGPVVNLSWLLQNYTDALLYKQGQCPFAAIASPYMLACTTTYTTQVTLRIQVETGASQVPII